MHELSFDKTINDFDLIVSSTNNANNKNNTMFRNFCKEVFQKSYVTLESQNNLDTGAKMLGIGIASVIKWPANNMNKGFLKNRFKN